MKKCEWCGKEFEPNKFAVSRQKFCSDKCRRRWRYYNPKHPEQTCRYCGKKFVPKGLDRTTYCSRQCAWADKRKPKIKKPKPIITCVICGKQFKGKTKQQKYCSDECRKEKKRQDARKYAEAKRKLVNKQVKCKECGKEFVPEYGNKRREFCSKLCFKRYNRRIGKAVRRARIKGRPYEMFDPVEIFERDKWRCQLCGRKTPKPLRGTTDDCAPELDHIIPLALGGSHTRANVQCLCRRCNQEKGATVLGQLRLF